MARYDVTRRMWRGGTGARCLALAALLASPSGLSGQEGMTVTVAPVLAHRLDRNGGVRVGFEAQWFPSSSGRRNWGLAVAYHPLGRFDDPVADPGPGDYFDESVAALGARIRWKLGISGRPFVILGADILTVQNEDAQTKGRDPAVGGFAGLGYDLTPGAFPVHLSLESGVHALAATGELTAGSGFYGTFSLGVAF